MNLTWNKNNKKNLHNQRSVIDFSLYFYVYVNIPQGEECNVRKWTYIRTYVYKLKLIKAHPPTPPGYAPE